MCLQQLIQSIKVPLNTISFQYIFKKNAWFGREKKKNQKVNPHKEVWNLMYLMSAGEANSFTFETINWSSSEDLRLGTEI